ncbi:restriction endonuclease subunit S [Psychrobacter alimentarius]|uniref:restriction endonuclease subunit S n=1 Tax=Psychrobacter alimentarius TaxID=261164 RepID=UPI003FD5913F
MSEVKNKKFQSGFQHTEIGIFPNDWSIHQLVDVAENNGLVRGPFGGALKKSSFVKKGFKVYEQRNAIYSSVDIGRYYISASKFQELSRFSLNSGDFIVSCSGTIGKIYQIPKNAPKGIINQALLKIKLNSLIEPRYFYQVFNSDSFQDRITDSTQGGAMKNLIGMSEFKKSIIPLPSLQEQTAIATALSDVDNLIQSIEKLIAKKEAIKTGTMQQLLTGKTRLPEFATRDDGSPKRFKQTELGKIPEDWELISIREICDFITGFPFPSSKYQESGIKLLRGSNVKRGNTDWSDNITKFWADSTSGIEQYLLQEGDVVISMDGSLVGRSFAQLSDTDLPALLLQRVARLRSKSISQDYLKEWVCSPVFSDYCDSVKTVTAIPHISPADILNFRLFVPSTRKEQTTIATILSDMDAEIQTLQQRLEKTKDIKQGMMQQLLTGKVRLAH